MTVLAVQKSTKENKRLFLGNGVIDFRLLSSETNNSIAVMDITIAAGTEPHRHVHEREDEIGIIQEGRLVYFIGEEIKEAIPGDVIFLPRGVPHHFKVLTEKAKLTLVVTPGGFDRFFWDLSTPFEENDIPNQPQQPSVDQVAAVKWLGEKFGVTFIQDVKEGN